MAIFKNFRMSEDIEARRDIVAAIMQEDARVVMRLAFHYGWVVLRRSYVAFVDRKPMTVAREFALSLDMGESHSDTMSRCNITEAHAEWLDSLKQDLDRPEGQLIRMAILLGFDAMVESLELRVPWQTCELVSLVSLERSEERRQRRKSKGRAEISGKPIIRKRKRSLGRVKA